MFTQEKAWAAINAAVEDIKKLPEDTLSQILGITIAGSLVRGDFIENNSDVDIYTILSKDAGIAWKSSVGVASGQIFDKYFAPYKGYTGNPYVWDNLIQGEDDLPKTSEDAIQNPFKNFSIYMFDFIDNHKTVYGKDFTIDLPRLTITKSLILSRLEKLLKRAEEIIKNEPENCFRIYMFAIEALKATQVYFSEMPSIHKDVVIENYLHNVPEFSMKSFGTGIWWDYVKTQYPDNLKQHKPLPEYMDFLKEINKICGLEQNI